MALVLADRVRETTTVTGTGTATLLGAVSGYQSFATIGNGNTTYYCIADQSGASWEVGLGTYSASTLTRTSVLASSNSNSVVNFAAGTKYVFCTYPASKSVYSDGANASGTWSISISGNAVSANNADTVDNKHAYEMSWGHDYSHGNWTDFNTFLNTPYFGAHFIQGSGNGPGHAGASQYYHQRMSLGSNYDNYSLQFAIPRNMTDSYLYYRYEEGGSAGSWYKMRAGYADQAGSLSTGNNYQVNSLGVGTAASGTAGEIRATNAITSYYSDGRLKDVIGVIENALDKVEQLSGVIYTQNKLAEQFGYNNYERQAGVIAQQVQTVLPEVVKPAPFDIDENGSSISGENYLTVQYDKLVPLLIEAIKELRAEVKSIKNGS